MSIEKGVQQVIRLGLGILAGAKAAKRGSRVKKRTGYKLKKTSMGIKHFPKNKKGIGD